MYTFAVKFSYIQLCRRFIISPFLGFVNRFFEIGGGFIKKQKRSIIRGTPHLCGSPLSAFGRNSPLRGALKGKENFALCGARPTHARWISGRFLKKATQKPSTGFAENLKFSALIGGLHLLPQQAAPRGASRLAK